MSELDDILKNWQPMKDAFNDLEYNSYTTGPGAGLPAILHATHEQSEKVSDETPFRAYLTMRNVPKRLGSNGIENLCRLYGNVKHVHYSQKCNMYFVDFATVCDMEVAFKHLSENNYGFEVYVGNQKKANENNNYNNIQNTETPIVVSNDNLEEQHGPQLDRRRIPLSEKQEPRPFIKSTPIIADDVQLNDPLSFHLFAEDAFTLDRAGLAGNKKKFPLSNNYTYYTGRSYLELTDVEKAFLEKNKQNNNNNQCEFIQGAGRQLLEEMDFGYCVNCQLPCISTCATYKVFVCSADCQKFMAKCEIDTEVKQTIPEFPPSGSKVCIMAINQANMLFIRAKSRETDIAFLKLISEIHNKSSQMKMAKFRVPPKTGQIVITKFANLYQRALVLNVQNLQAIRLMFLDYGNIIEKSMKELYYAPNTVQNLPRFVMPVLLKGIPEFYMKEQLSVLLYAQLEHNVFKLHYDKVTDFDSVKKTYAVELIETVSNDNLNQFVYRLCNPEPPMFREEIITENNMHLLPLTTGENIELLIMDRSWLESGHISCSQKPYLLEIQKFQKDIERYMADNKDTEPYTPRPNELCLAKYSVDNKWYRGIGMETVGDGFPTIEFLDFGNVQAVSLNNIRRYPQQFQFPICTHICKIDDLPKTFSCQLLKRLDELLQVRETLICDKVYEENDEHDNVYIIQISNIINQLKKEGLFSDPNSDID